MASPSTTLLDFAGDPALGRLETDLESIYRAGAAPQHLTLDLRLSKFVLPEALVFILATAADRTRRGLNTGIRPPDSPSVKDFLFAWSFWEALTQVTERPLSDFVTASELVVITEHLANASRRPTRYAPRWIEIDGSAERILSEDWFALTTYLLRESESRTRMVVAGTEKWRGRLVQSVLQRHLRGASASYVPNQIVFEALMNAARHPDATRVTTVSDFPSDSPLFTVVFWDDGQSMIHTLVEAAREGSISTARTDPYGRPFNIRVRHASRGTPERRQVLRDFTPEFGKHDAVDFLVACCLPGITSDPLGKRTIAGVSSGAPGMGLPLLLNAAVDIYGGTVAFRTAHHFLSVSAANRATYEGSVRVFDEAMPAFFGNMVTVRLPLRPKANASTSPS